MLLLEGITHSIEADSLLGNLGNKIWHSNNDSVTNEWASKIIGHDLISMESRSQNKKRTAFFADTVTKSIGYQYLPQVLPREFTNLKSGGKLNNFIVEGVVQVTGKTWNDGKNFQIIQFSQK